MKNIGIAMRTTTAFVTDEDALIAVLKKQCGKLWIVLELMGISVFKEKRRKGFLYSLFRIRKICYPLFLHCNLFYLLYGTIHTRKEVLNYAFIIDMIMPMLINVMWWIIYMRRFKIRIFLVHVAQTMSVSLILQTRLMAHVIDATLLLIFVYPFIIIKIMVSQSTIDSIKIVEVFRPVHEIIFPSIMGVMYTAICYLFYRNLQIFKAKFKKELNLSSMITVTKLKNNYLDVVKGVEMIENLFSVPVLMLVVKNVSIISIVVMDMMHKERNWMAEQFLEAVLQLTFVFGTMGVLAVYAANIPLEMSGIKSVLLDKMSEQSTGDGLHCGEKQINYIIQRDVIVLTAWNVFELDKPFILKLLIGVIAQAVVIYQLSSAVKLR
ncbi:uncharacterized protein NPIL_596961 [Nephila pilipes]|uniref:Uncharacterized protein n=2 Tax=Nephila pilipes TaxID=299642 RepID=A0A8X6Q5K7_NEPPI|nr:uncharacterized protein NPIL_175251 [Nephila pilipes]GFU07694.1 uncharacterized protein NPIL_422091 [Nephila pilipes]GFU10520.1 uncharacterized protein NPIL_596961 [Nephila pilipes]